MKKAQAKKLGLQTVQKQLKKPIDGNNQVKSDKKKHIEQKNTSDLKNTVNTPYKEKKNIESHINSKSNLLTKNIELSEKRRKMEEYSKTIGQKKFSKTNTTQNQTPKKTINNSISSNNNESPQLTGNVQGKPKGKVEDNSNTIGQNNFPNKTTTQNQTPKKTINNSISSNNNESPQLTRSVQGKPKSKVEDNSNAIGQNNFPNKTTTQNQTPKKTINNSISSNNNESSQLTRSVRGKPRLSFIKTTNITNKGSTHKTNQTDKNNNIKKSNTMQENNPQRKIINNAIINTDINPDSKQIQTPKGIETGNKSFNIGATPKKQQNNNPLSRKSSKKILEGNKEKDIKIDETNNKKTTLTDGKTQETLLNEEKKLQNDKSIIDAKKSETSESKQGDPSNETENENNYKKQIDYINYFKPYYSVDIQENLIQFSILLYQNESSIDEKTLRCIDKNDYYEVVVEGKKEKPQQINGEMININYGSFRIESEIEKKIKGDNRKYEPKVKADNNGYVLVTFTPVL